MAPPPPVAALTPLVDAWDWQLDAACRGLDVEIFYHPAAERRSTKQRRIDQAKTICAGCPCACCAAATP